MDTTRFSVLLTFIGFLYLSAGVFLILSIEQQTDFQWLSTIQGALPYLSAAAIPICYFVGFASHIIVNTLAVPCILRRLSPRSHNSESNMQLKILQFGSPALIKALQEDHAKFISLRLLVVSLLFLGWTALPWLMHSRYHEYWVHSLVIWIVFLVLTASLYVLLHDDQLTSEKRVFHFLDSLDSK